MNTADIIYDEEVREKIRLDLALVKEKYRLHWSSKNLVSADDRPQYIVEAIQNDIDQFRKHIDPTVSPAKLHKGFVSRKLGLKNVDDDIIDIIIKYIDGWWDGEYQRMVDGYLNQEDSPSSGSKQKAATHESDPAWVLANFRFRVDRFLTAGPFSYWLLSVHITFAALYVFAAMAITWAVGGELQFGNPLLPGGADGGAARGFDSTAAVQSRFNILALVVVIVVVFFIGLITAAVDTNKRQNLSQNVLIFAVASAPINGIVLWLSGVDDLFSAAYSCVLTAAIVLSHRTGRREALGFIAPFAILLCVLIAVALSVVRPGANAPGGILAVAAFLVLTIGGLCGRNRGGIAAALTAVVLTGAMALINAVYFPSWFKLDRWEPGTVTGFLILPFLNGFWDWVSLSATRSLSGSALKAVKRVKSQRDAALILVRAALIDTALAVVFIILLFSSLEIVTAAYNHFLHGGQVRSSVTSYFEAFQKDIFTAKSLFVILIICTVMLPTLVHVHAVSSAMLGLEGIRNISSENTVRWASYALLMVVVLVLLLLLVRSAIDIVAAIIPTLTVLIKAL